MRTKAEIRAFCDSKVGHICVDKSDARLNGQCVCFIKNLMEFLGVPNPYGARGNAKDAGDAYIAQGIGTAGRGWLAVCVNRSMGGGYGHIWVDLSNEGNYESNGAAPLLVTKNTRPITQAQQFINFDQWVQEVSKEEVMNANDVGDMFHICRGVSPNKDEIAQWVGKPMKQLKDVLRAQQSWNDQIKNAQVGATARRDKWQERLQAFEAAKSDKGTALKPGTYIVK